MKQLIFFIAFIITAGRCYAQTGTPTMSYNGVYVAKTSSATPGMEIYTYLRFYKDGSVILSAVNSYDPLSVGKWFGRYNKFSQKGVYSVKESEISVSLSNKESEDYKLEGLVETKFDGQIKNNKKICVKRDAEKELYCFEFQELSDTTRIKYTEFKPEIKLPGEWRIKQKLKGSGQVIFTNDDSAIVAVSVFKAHTLPDFEDNWTDFETVNAYYVWESKYMKDEQQMKVQKIAEDKQNAWIIWSSKDANNDSYYLFGRSRELLYNFMIDDKKMSLEKKQKILKALYQANKD